jgi:hypothetical protein
MILLDYEIETVYYLENPETDKVRFATGSQLRYEDVIKDVFGVASIQDLPMMIQYNKGFQTSICKSHGISENEITIDMIVRVASEGDLQQYKEQVLNEQFLVESQQVENKQCPFEPVIRLQEGIFKWDLENNSYLQVKHA